MTFQEELDEALHEEWIAKEHLRTCQELALAARRREDDARNAAWPKQWRVRELLKARTQTLRGAKP